MPPLCSSSQGSLRLGVQASSWSRSINLETLGMHANIHVHGPSSAGPSSYRGADAAGILEHMAQETIHPRSIDPLRRRNPNRWFLAPCAHQSSSNVGDCSSLHCKACMNLHAAWPPATAVQRTPAIDCATCCRQTEELRLLLSR